ncbi:MAG: HD domain-containing protein [Methylococcaceae bacterium]
MAKKIFCFLFFVFCLALHDLGKFARAFQGLKQPSRQPWG